MVRETERGGGRDRGERERPSRRGADDDDNPRGGRGRSAGFQYRSRDPDKVRSRAEQGGGSNDSYLKDNVKLFKAAEGVNELRILPPTWEGAEHYGLDIHIHYGIGPDNSAYLCLAKMKNKPCPVCEERKRAVAEGDTDYADELRASHRVATYVVDRAKGRDGAAAWVMGKRMDQDILRLCVDHKTNETLEIDHPEDGYDLSFSRDGQGMKTRYTGMQIARRSSALDNDKALEFVTENPLPDMLIFYSYDHIQSMFNGKTEKRAKDDDDAPPKDRKSRDDDDKPARGRAREEERPAERVRRETKRGDSDMTWAEVHDMTFKALAAIIDEERLDIDPDLTRDDEELADQVCDALGIEEEKKPLRDAGGSGRRKLVDDDDPPPRDERRERLRDAQRGGR